MTQEKIEGKFYPLTPDVARKLREAKLTAAEWRLWSYLVELDPFGDRYIELPDTITIMQECDMKKSTFYAAIAKFQALELFDFQYQSILARNLAIPKNRKAVREIGNDSENSENQTPEPLPKADSNSPQTLQTYIEKNFKELYEDYQKVYGKEKIPAPVLPSISSIIHTGLWTDEGYWMS